MIKKRKVKRNFFAKYLFFFACKRTGVRDMNLNEKTLYVVDTFIIILPL